MKGKVINWNTNKAFGFIASNGGGEHIFIHKTAFTNSSRIPQLNDVITFSVAKDKQGRYCAEQAIFAGEKSKKKATNNISSFFIYLLYFLLC